MNKYIELGKYNRLQVYRLSEPGAYLSGSDSDKEVLLPNAYVGDLQKDDYVDVFVYNDSEDREVATTIKPTCIVGDFTTLNIVDKSQHGYFLDWGLPKDLFLPNMLTTCKDINIDDKLVIHVKIDEKTNRIVATQKFSKDFESDTSELKNNQKVDILVYDETKLGFKVIVENSYDGLIFKNEVFEKLKIGDKRKAFIKNIRRDKKLDISLQPFGKKRSLNSSDTIINMLKDSNGSLPYNYKSDAELIYKTFSMSKKEFKRTLTLLSEKKLIEIKESGIKLCKR
jgi:predicted RNA-binding protein (virulence factor B family)